MTPQRDIDDDRPDCPRANHQHALHAAPGQVLVLFAISLFVLIGFVALAVDGGFIMAERRQAQSAADAGALAGAADLLARKYAQIETSGQEYGSDTADIEIGVDGNVDINCLPDPANCSTATQVEAIVTKDVNKFFVGAVYGGDWQVGARAVASIDDYPIPNALIALNECHEGGLGIEVTGNPEIHIENGRGISNCGIDHTGNANFVDADQLLAVGSVDCNDTWDVVCGSAPEPVRDPVEEAGVLPPTWSQASPNASAVFPDAIIDTEAELQANVKRMDGLPLEKVGPRYICPSGITCRMNSGVYGGSLKLEIKGTLELMGYGNKVCDDSILSNTLYSTLFPSATMNSTGIFYFTDSFLLAGSSAGSRICGKDVLLYFGPGVYGNPATTAQFDPANAIVDLHAYQAGAEDPEPLYQYGQPGMLLWIDNCTDFVMQSNGSFNMNGIIYAPCSYVELYGTPGSYGIQVIVGELVLTGTGQFTILYRDYISTDTPMVFLVE